MKNTLLTFALLFTLTLLTSCKSTTESSSNNAQACNIGTVRLTADFATGRMQDCKALGDNEFLITLLPESTPINPSPWYAFKVEADQPTDIKLIMKVKGDKHRYPPKISHDGKHWQLQAHKLTGDRLVIEMSATQQPAYIAAQEIIDNRYYVNWGNELQKTHNVSHQTIGKSTQGRAIYKIESKSESNEWLVILGRMHPPEVTGALALFPFVKSLLNNNVLANKFREKYNILVIPNINPDGVDAGNWRHNTNGHDLNRDWINFSQKETQLVNSTLKNLVANQQKIKFAIDFHSTQHDVFYTMPINYGVENKYFVQHWLTALDNKMPNFKVITQPGNTPNNGVSKQYFADTFNVHAITYEVGDNTSREKIKRIATNAATTLMRTMLSDVDHNKE